MILVDAEFPSRCTECPLYLSCKYYNTGDDVFSRPGSCPIKGNVRKEAMGNIEKTQKAVAGGTSAHGGEDTIRLGEEYWLDRFIIETRHWKSEDNGERRVSFIIRRKEEDADS